MRIYYCGLLLDSSTTMKTFVRWSSGNDSPHPRCDTPASYLAWGYNLVRYTLTTDIAHLQRRNNLWASIVKFISPVTKASDRPFTWLRRTGWWYLFSNPGTDIFIRRIPARLSPNSVPSGPSYDLLQRIYAIHAAGRVLRQRLISRCIAWQ